MRFYQFSDLKRDMKSHGQSIEQFYITYASVKFDILFDISNEPYELLIGAVHRNWACILQMGVGYELQMPDKIFYSLRDLLNLNNSAESLTSFKFLKYIADRVPHKCSNKLVAPYHLVPFRQSKIKKIDEPEKTVFIGWNDHKRDKRTAHNFDKTEQYFGKICADYCRKNNVSSMWTYPKDIDKENVISYPWEI